MVFIKKILAVSLALAIPCAVSAAPWVAPYSSYSLFLDGPNPTWAPYYTSISTSTLGTVKFLQYNTVVDAKLKSMTYASGKVTGYKSWNNIKYQQISEPGYIGECVGFGKAMTGIGGTGTWAKNPNNAISKIFTNAKVGSISADIALPPGTLIANFDGDSTYNNKQTNHVAIVLGVVTSGGVVTGANVVSQNAISVVANVSASADRMINKYFLPWDNSKSSLTSFSLKNYYVISK